MTSLLQYLPNRATFTNLTTLPYRAYVSVSGTAGQKISEIRAAFQTGAQRVGYAIDLTKKSFSWVKTNAPYYGGIFYTKGHSYVKLTRDFSALMGKKEKEFLTKAAVSICAVPFIYFPSKLIAKGVVYLSSKTPLSLDLAKEAVTHSVALKSLYFAIAFVFLVTAFNNLGNLHSLVLDWSEVKESRLEYHNETENSPAYFSGIEGVENNPTKCSPAECSPAEVIGLMQFWKERTAIAKGEKEIPADFIEDIEKEKPEKRDTRLRKAYHKKSKLTFIFLETAMDYQIEQFQKICVDSLHTDRKKLYDHIQTLGPILTLVPNFEKKHDRLYELTDAYEQLQQVRDAWVLAIDELKPPENPGNVALDIGRVISRTFTNGFEGMQTAGLSSFSLYFLGAVISIILGKEAVAAAALRYALKKTIIGAVLGGSINALSSVVNDLSISIIGYKPASFPVPLSSALTFALLSVV